VTEASLESARQPNSPDYLAIARTIAAATGNDGFDPASYSKHIPLQYLFAELQDDCLLGVGEVVLCPSSALLHDGQSYDPMLVARKPVANYIPAQRKWQVYSELVRELERQPLRDYFNTLPE
jgi:hypothetical protein